MLIISSQSSNTNNSIHCLFLDMDDKLMLQINEYKNRFKSLDNFSLFIQI